MRKIVMKTKILVLIISVFTLLHVSCELTSVEEKKLECDGENKWPELTIVKPVGGAVFTVGQPCTVQVRYTGDKTGGVGAVLKLYTERGLNDMNLPQNGSQLMVATDSIFVFTIPDSLENDMFDRFSTVSKNCMIKAEKYGNASFYDETDCYFEIRK